MSAYPPPLTPNSIQTAMQALTAIMLGIIQPPLTGPISNAAASLVRINWQRLGQPYQSSDGDIAYLGCVEVDDPPVNRVRDVNIIPNPADTFDPPHTCLQAYTYMRVWETTWDVYGPNSFDNVRKIHSALFTQQVHDTFAALNLALYWVTDSSAPRRVPYYSDGKWWEFTTFSARFNELVTESVVVPIAASVEVKLYSEIDTSVNHPDADFTVDLQQ